MVQVMGHMPNCPRREPHFLPNSSYQITHCTNLGYLNGIQSLSEKNIIATKMKEIG
jgi:hypothetical protein